VRKVGSSSMRSVGFITIGCKLNQFETEQMREAAALLGYLAAEDPVGADVCVINTCTVTSKSDYRSRQAVRRVIRTNPGALVVVTGCYAQRSPAEVAAMPGVDVVLGNPEKEEIGAYLGLSKQAEPLVRAGEPGRVDLVAPRRHLRGFGRYTRAFVKIQDGCDNRCAYCAVPAARGRSRSKRTEEVRGEVETLVGEGYREIVLTGVHLGAYGRDLAPRTSLARLLASLADLQGLARLRLSSVEPTDLTGELVELAADPSSKVCPHFHVPLQSGDNDVLRSMGRPYDREHYRRVIDNITASVSLCGIGADVMVGFPGETARAFANTRDLVRDLGLTYLHVFSFSTRPGTQACHLPAHVDPETRAARSAEMRRMGKEKAAAFRKSLVGKTVDTLVLAKADSIGATGLSGNYVKVNFKATVAPNTLVRARVVECAEGAVWAEAEASA
jgi:threonylcarbamoyladenosine tRNA methylthiotransferase MtaB